MSALDFVKCHEADEAKHETIKGRENAKVSFDVECVAVLGNYFAATLLAVLVHSSARHNFVEIGSKWAKSGLASSGLSSYVLEVVHVKPEWRHSRSKTLDCVSVRDQQQQ